MVSMLALMQLGAGEPPPPPLGYTRTLWTVEEGLPQNSVNGIATDVEGFMWLATYAGPVRFDGLHFTREAEGLPNRQTSGLLRSRSGEMILGTIGHGLYAVREGRVRRVDAPGALAHPVVTWLAEDEDRRIWVGTRNGLTVLEPGSGDALLAGRSWLSIGDHPVGEVDVIATAPDGGVWLSAGDRVCRAHADGSATCPPEGRHPNGVRLKGLLMSRAGVLWMVWADGRLRVLTDAGVVETPWCDGLDPCLPFTSTVRMMEDRHGRIWIATSRRVHVLADEGRLTFTDEHGLPGHPIHALFQDREGGVWIGTDGGGLLQLRPARVRMFGTETEGTSSVVPGAEEVSAVSRCGVLHVSRLGEQRCDDPLPGRIIVAAHRAADGGLWLATYSGGVFHWDGRSEPRAVGLDGTILRSLHIDRGGALWVGAESGVHRLGGGGELEPVSASDDPRYAVVVAFANDRNGRVWIGSNGGGLSVYEGDSLRFVGRSEGLTSLQVSALHEDNTGTLWVGTSDRGLWRRFEGRFLQFDMTVGLAGPTVTQIVEDRDGDLWVGSNRGITRLPRDGIEAFSRGQVDRLDVVTVDRTDGMWSAETSGGGFHPAGAGSPDGRLWFSTVSGLATVDPATFPVNRVRPPAHITGYRVEQGVDRPLGAADTIRVEAGATSFEVHYTAIGFTNARRMRFRYRLTGFEDAWVEAGDRRAAYFTRLRPGRYGFEVEASNNDGLWSATPSRSTVLVLPHFWETRAFLAALLAAIVGASAAVGRRSVHYRARRRLAALEREQALHRERSRIARDLHDDLGSRLTRIALLADLSGADGGGGVEVAEVARDASVAMDELVWSIDVRNDTVRGLAEYAAHFAEEHLRPSGIRCSIDLPVDLPRAPIGADSRRQAFLAFKEVVNNVVKHSGAGHATVRFWAAPDRFGFLVRDDGCGFVPADAGGLSSNGLRNLQERVRGSSGRLIIDSRPGEGTAVRVELPIAAPE